MAEQKHAFEIERLGECPQARGIEAHGRLDGLARWIG
jgi:hypothetical protein